MKKFEEEMKEWFGSPTGFNMEFQSGYEAYCALVKRFKGYISPEGHQANLGKQQPEIPDFVDKWIGSKELHNLLDDLLIQGIAPLNSNGKVIMGVLH